MSIWDWLIVLGLNGAIIAYGFYLSRGTSSSSEWFLGGRSLPWWGLGLSMFATCIDNADLVSVTGHVYNNGVHILSIFTIATVLGCCLTAFGIVPVMYRAGCYTNAEYLERRFGPSLRLISALVQIQYRTAILGLMVWSVFLMLTGAAGLEPWLAWSLIGLLVVLTAAYTVWGGLASVVWTDALQSFIIMAGAGCIFVAVWNGVGGLAGLHEKLNTLPDVAWDAEAKVWVGAKENAQPVLSQPIDEGETVLTQPLSNWLRIGQFNNPSEQTSPYIVLIGWIIIGLGYYSVNHTQTMRLMGARSLWDMKMAALVGGLVGIPLMLIVVILGVCGRVLYPELTAAGGKADELFPLLTQDYLSTGFKGVVLAGIISATISTFDSMGSALSALFTRDIYARWIKKNGSDAHYLTVGRWATIGVLMLGFLYLPFILKQRNMVDASLKLIPIFVTPLLTIYILGALTRAHRKSGLVGMMAGASLGIVCFLHREGIWQDSMPFELPHYLYGNWYSYIWALLVTSGSMFLTTLILGKCPPHEELPTDSNVTGWLARSTDELPEAKEHPFKNEVPFWLQPRWFALVLIIFNAWITFGLFW